MPGLRRHRHDDLDLYRKCRTGLPYNRLGCRCSGVRLPESAVTRICGKCRLKSPVCDSTTALFVYSEPIRYLIKSLKFGSSLAAAQLLGSLMAPELRSLNPVSEALIPVPLHRIQFIQRGFNQSIEIARPLSRIFGIPMLLQHCVRRRRTCPQPGSGPQRPTQESERCLSGHVADPLQACRDRRQCNDDRLYRGRTAKSPESAGSRKDRSL